MIRLVNLLKPVADTVVATCKMLFGLDRPQLYRPEAHYMRGPGPKWREKQALTHGRMVVQRLPARR